MNKNIIFIVEDSATQAGRLKNILEKHGYLVYAAKNGKDALNQLNNSKIQPVLLISDIMMPEMNGYELCKNLRSNPQFKHLPIILLTTLSEAEDIVKGLECGANFFVTKPYEEEELINQVQYTLDLKMIRLSEENNDKVKILINSNEYLISAQKTQILDLLVSIYSAAVKKNQQLESAQVQLQEFNALLEEKVEKRTAALNIEIANHKAEIAQRIKTEKELSKTENQYKVLAEKLQESLHEKEVLLKEIYHRVKNNLQVVSSLLQLQADAISEPTLQRILLENVARLRSMALVHNMLYETDNLSEISMKSYIENLFEFFCDIYSVNANQIELILNIQDILLEINLAIPCGLILNELISNAFIHAFPAKKSGKIHVSFTPEDEYAVLVVQDDGMGMPAAIDIENAESLGLSLIRNLTRQLNGTITLDKNNGTKWILRFPKSQ